MKKFFNRMLWVMILQCGMNAFAQGTVYDSSLGASAGSVPIDGTDWIGQEIQTGNNPGGYVLDSIQVQMAAASGTPSGFVLSLFSVVNGVPLQSLGNLSGPANPATAGVYSYDASALNLTLAPSTDYFVVEGAANPSSQGSYEWGITGGDAVGVDGWEYLALAYSHDQGNDWARTGRLTYQIAVTATAVPEPSTWVLCLLGGGLAFYLHARQRRALRANLG